uniref:NADH dehydrogenase [ubiquinone] 1 beta subcomplex subunit 10 n=1 Tax=Sphenodon punctatus TaxID=8508 RepID=A0A8D0HAK2_SPHPU
MAEEPDRDVYPEPPRRTPAPNPQSAIPNPLNLVYAIFHYGVDVPVTAFREWMEQHHAKNRYYYYQQTYRRVPDLTQCLEADFPCIYEAELQWKRDYKVDQEIIKIMRDRLTACMQREKYDADQMCAKEKEQFTQTSKAYQTKYGDLGGFGNSKSCLMKQKHRMIDERKAGQQKVQH